MRAVYSTCWADPWIKIASSLKNSHRIEPIYWIGYDDDNSEHIIKLSFPNIIYHRYFDAWKGIFPDGLKEQYEPINIDFLNDFAGYELQAIKMMDRMDSDQHSFSFIERQRHFRNLIRKWFSIINIIKPDLVISAVVPHRVYDYVLFLVCKHKRIPFISFKNTAFTGRIISLTGIYDIEPITNEEYLRIKGTYSNSDIINKLPVDIRKEYEIVVNKDYCDAEPSYMKRHVISNKNDASLVGITKKFILRIIDNQQKFLGSKGYLVQGIPTYLKRRNSSIENSNAPIIWHVLRKIKNNSFKKNLKKYYEKNVENPNYEDKYIFLPLHYQPEMTSNPSGDIFVDQMLCIDILTKGIPTNYKIYVKEHKAQFYSHTEGHTSRNKDFYDDLLKYPNVKLVPLEEDVFKLITNSIAVATVTGTAGWEAIVRKKPVIIFGLSWYEAFDGVIKIRSQKDVEKILPFINNYTYDENNLLSYLLAHSKCSTRGYYYRNLKSKMDQSEDECVNNLVSCIKKLVESE
jgi:hypothetical protein